MWQHTSGIVVFLHLFLKHCVWITPFGQMRYWDCYRTTIKPETSAHRHRFKRLVPKEAIFLTFIWALELFLQRRTYWLWLMSRYKDNINFIRLLFWVRVAVWFHRTLGELQDSWYQESQGRLIMNELVQVILKCTQVPCQLLLRSY